MHLIRSLTSATVTTATVAKTAFIEISSSIPTGTWANGNSNLETTTTAARKTARQRGWKYWKIKNTLGNSMAFLPVFFLFSFSFSNQGSNSFNRALWIIASMRAGLRVSASDFSTSSKTVISIKALLRVTSIDRGPVKSHQQNKFPSKERWNDRPGF